MEHRSSYGNICDYKMYNNINIGAQFSQSKPNIHWIIADSSTFNNPKCDAYLLELRLEYKRRVNDCWLGLVSYYLAQFRLARKVTTYYMARS